MKCSYIIELVDGLRLPYLAHAQLGLQKRRVGRRIREELCLEAEAAATRKGDAALADKYVYQEIYVKSIGVPTTGRMRPSGRDSASAHVNSSA